MHHQAIYTLPMTINKIFIDYGSSLPIPTIAIGSGHSEGDGSFPKTSMVLGNPGIVLLTTNEGKSCRAIVFYRSKKAKAL